MRTTIRLTLLLLLLVALPPSRAADAPATTQVSGEGFEPIAKELGISGDLKDGVYTVSLARKDLDVHNEDGDVPPGVLKSEFQFYRCDCGKMNVVGQFCVAEYESNDVIDALRGGMMKVASVSPMLQGESPRVMIVRFQGAGGSQQLAKTIKGALDWTGEARMAPATRPAR
jgi:hypothetical protein